MNQQTSADSIEARRIALHLESGGHAGVERDVRKEGLDSRRALS
jgi:hypothetical protein